MLVAGTVNTLLTKWADLQVVGADPRTGERRHFRHPAFQSALMFAGELLCLAPWLFFRARRRAAKRRADPAYLPALDAAQRRALGLSRAAAFALPALCDAAASTAMNLGLALTSASTYQMLRGTLVLWTGLFTVGVLRRRLRAHHWMGMVLITAGAALVGAASVLAAAGSPGGGRSGGRHGDVDDDDDEGGGGGRGGGGGLVGSWRGALLLAGGGGGGGGGGKGVERPLPAPDRRRAFDPTPLLGDALVVAAQAGTAMQFVLEEAFLRRYRVPALLAVGLEGAWGAALSAALLLPLAARVHPGGPGTPPLDDLGAAARELAANPRLAAASLLSVFSVALFNFCGIGVTKRLSGASRATIDATRTLFVWLFALACGWERAMPLQMLGFAVLVAGSSLYNEILRPWMPADLVAASAAAAAAAVAAERAAAEGGSGHGGGPAGLRYHRVTPAPSAHGGGGGGDEEEEEEDQEVVLVVDGGDDAAAAGISGGGASAAATEGGASSVAVPVPAARTPALPSPWGGYALARSMRLGPGALSPRSLVPGGGSALGIGGGAGRGRGASGTLLLDGSVVSSPRAAAEAADRRPPADAAAGGSNSASGSASSSSSSSSSLGSDRGTESAGGASSPGSLLGAPAYLAAQRQPPASSGAGRGGGGAAAAAAAAAGGRASGGSSRLRGSGGGGGSSGGGGGARGRR
jgi:drug/metabolite transporter (DMT)-like permease